MIPDKTTSEPNGDTRRHRWHAPGLPLAGLTFADGSGRQLASLKARQLRRAPGVPGSWSRFVIAHARWILLVTFCSVAAAAVLAHSQTRMYTSEAEVYVGFSAAEGGGGTLQAPDMATEKGIVSSGVVLASAARSLGVSPTQLARGLSANVPASTYLLQILYSSPWPRVSQERAEAVAKAYVSYRAPRPARTEAGPAAKAATTLAPTPTANLVTSASLPSSPSSPSYPIDLGAALIVGLGLGLGTAGILDHFDDHLRGPHELEALAGAPVLALIPSFWPARGRPAKRLAVATSPDSVVAEAYRVLRTRVVHTAALKGSRTLLVTSTTWEEKSTVAANLALSLAQAGYRTILVGADLRWGSAHELFGVPNRGGLTSVLEMQTDLADELQSTGLPWLRVLPPGPRPADSAAIVQRPALRTVIRELRAHAHFVIIDGPPVLASAETGPLGDLAEMILPVADGRRSTRAQVRAAVREMQRTESKVVGWVLDNVGRRRFLRRLPGPAEATGAQRPGGWPEPDATDDGHEPGLPDAEGTGPAQATS